MAELVLGVPAADTAPSENAFSACSYSLA